jgi:hypothetical protein
MMWKTVFFTRTNLIFPFFIVNELVGCSSLTAPKMERIPILTIAHYGEGIGISEIFVNGSWAGNQTGWGGGGGEICCARISSDRSHPVLIDVKWETCDIRHIEYRDGIRVDPNARCRTAWHKAIVPIHFAERIPGNHFGLNIHFLPGHKVEAWTSDKDVLEDSYPGPKYPHSPAPNYIPLPGEDVVPENEVSP